MSADMNGFPEKGSLKLIKVDEDRGTLNRAVPVTSLSANGSDSNIDLALAPKGTGAFQLSPTDGSATNGNKRGNNAIDLQTSRSAATQVASGLRSVAIGSTITNSGADAVALGSGHAVSGANSFASGAGNTVSAVGACAMNSSNQATGTNSFITGNLGSTFAVIGRMTHSSTRIAALGDSQSSKFGLRGSTTNATPLVLTVDMGAASILNTVTLQNNNAFAFTGLVVCKESGSVVSSSWKIEGHIVRGANAAATTLVVSTITAISNATAIPGPALTADTANGSLAVTVTGVAATNLRWFANIETAEIIYA